MKVKIKDTGEIVEVEVRKDADTGKTFYLDDNFNAYAEDEVELLENKPKDESIDFPITIVQKAINDINKNTDVVTFWKYFRCDIFKICIQQGFDFNKAAGAANLATEKLYADCKAFEDKILNNKK